MFPYTKSSLDDLLSLLNQVIKYRVVQSLYTKSLINSNRQKHTVIFGGCREGGVGGITRSCHIEHNKLGVIIIDGDVTMNPYNTTSHPRSYKNISIEKSGVIIVNVFV